MTNAFSPKEIIYDDEMLDKLEAGAKAVHDAVGRTMGPSGQLVMYEEDTENPYPTVTKDGVSVASMIAFEDPAENMGAQFVIQAARKQVYETGDGTTLTSILTYKLFKEGRKMIAAGFSPNEIISGIRSCVKDVTKSLEAKAIKEIDLNILQKIASVATNSDNDLSYQIAQAVHQTGKYGMVFQRRSPDEGHSVEYQEGYQLDVGILAREFANLEGKMMGLNNPYVLVTDQKIVDATRLTPILRKIQEQMEEQDKGDEKLQLVIFSPQIGGDVLQVMKRNITDPEGQFFMVHIRPTKDLKPEKSRIILEDLASLTGGMFISEDSGYQIDKLELNQLGRCKNISSYPEKTLVLGYEGESKKRINELTAQKETVTDNYTKGLINESLARLSGGVATISVGGKNLTEQTEALFRVDDAVKSCKSAQEMGYVRGGGVAMLEECKRIGNDPKNTNPGYRLALDSLKYPAKLILTNGACDSWQMKIAEILVNNRLGYSMSDKDGGKTPDMYDIGIVDPAKVIIYALKNAASSAISMLKTSVMIVAKGKKDA